MDTSNEHLKVGEALQIFYDSEHLGNDALVRSVNYADFGIIKIPYPNLKKRQELVHLHDVNHILTGYDTTWIGEGEVAAWELASGFPPHCWVGYLYAPFTFIVGFALSPSRILKAFRRGRREKNSCHAMLNKEEILNITVSELRKFLGINNVALL